MITRYLNVIDVLAIHKLQIDKFGGSAGLRDPGQLEAALFRPQSGYYTDLVAEAAALWESLSQNHPFVDGNKRTAMMSTFIFLRMNGVGILASDAESKAFVKERYESGTFIFDNVEVWLRANVSQRVSP